MKSLVKKLLSAAVCVAISMSLCGCDMFAFDTAELLSPPEPSGNASKILQALNDSVADKYDLVYPSGGELQSPIIEDDIDNDGVDEALAFYSTNDGERQSMHINLIVKNGDNWKSVDDISIEAGGVESVEFCDLDQKGNKEILVGWEIYAVSERQLAVYSVDNNSLSQVMLQRYTSFVCCDIDQNGLTEIFLQDLNTADGTNRAMLSSIDENGVLQLAGCMLDSTVKSAALPIVAKLSDGRPAVYIDETKGAGAITEVLYCEGGELVNGLLDTSKEPFTNNVTIRASTISCRDSDGDGVLEIPVEVSVPNADQSSTEKISYVDWCVYSGKELKRVSTSIVNTIDGYMISVPEKWRSEIAILKDTDKHQRTVYAFDSVTNTIGEKIITFKAVEIENYTESNSCVELARTDSAVICAILTEYNGSLKLTDKELSEIVKLF